MRPRLALTDRNLLLGVGLLFALICLATIFLSPDAADPRAAGIPSTYSSSPRGTRAAYLLLSALHYNVHRWEDSPEQLVTIKNPATTVLILAEPSGNPTARQRAALQRFVTSGARVLICGPIRLFFPDAAVTGLTTDSKTYPALLPSLFTNGVREADFGESFAGKMSLSRALPLFGSPERAPVILAPSGQGEILWWSNANPLTNSGITAAGNLTLFLNALHSDNSSQPLTIYFDEYFHGAGLSLWDHFQRSAAIWSLPQLALLAAAVFWTAGRRWRPLFTPPAPSRLSPLEYVNTLGGLYRRAKATGVATAVTTKALRFRLSRRLALPLDTTDEALANAAASRLGWNHGKLLDTLRRATRVSNQSHAPESVTLNLIQTMSEYMRDLRAVKNTAPAREQSL